MPTTNQNDLPPKLKAVLIRLGRAQQLNVTQAAKLPYLVDVVANHVLGRRITEGSHETWEYGVVTSQVWHYLDKCEDSPVFHLEPVPFSEEKRVVIDAEEATPVLTPEEEAVVDFVARELAFKAAELGQLTKLMNPETRAWGSNRKADEGRDAYERMTDDYQWMAKRAASVTLDHLRRTSMPVEDIEDAVA